MPKKIVAYYRCSTKKQQASGLGLAAQRHDVEALAASEKAAVVGEYTEAESAWKDSLHNRPRLQEAIDHAISANAVLAIAKLDRLCRSVFVTQLLKRSGVKFLCCDMPHANTLTIDIIAAVNEDESRRTSLRTKAAMAAAKRNGCRFGTPGNLSAAAAKRGRILGAQAVSEKAREAYKRVEPVILRLKAEGKNNSEIACALNALSYETRRNCAWTRVQVARVLQRAA